MLETRVQLSTILHMHMHMPLDLDLMYTLCALTVDRKLARATCRGGGGGACNGGETTLFRTFSPKVGGGRNSEQGVSARQYGNLIGQ